MSVADKRLIQKKDGLKVRQLSIPDSDHQLIKTEGLMNGMKDDHYTGPSSRHLISPKGICKQREVGW